MMKKGADYYLKNSINFGWGEDSAVLDKERCALLKQFIFGKKILDIGCGTGVYLDFLKSLGMDAWGVDFVKEFIEKGKKKNSNLVYGKAEELPFKNNEFDTVLMFDILEHGDDEKLLKEAKRVSKNRIIVIVPTHVDKRLLSSGVIYKHYIDKSHLREYSQAELAALAKRAGLKIIDMRLVQPLYVETIFMALFNGPNLLKKIIRKVILALFKKAYYPTEVFAVLEKTSI
jgi:2-polyprenyl-3-methyl-5-hydroxy-6-metoxy-1,4-benzoquinol methylase